MKLPPELLLLLSVLQPATAIPIDSRTPSLTQRSASFRALHGLTHLSNDYSNPESFSHPTKFFHESTFSGHYDGRFASTELPHHTRLFHLRLLLKAYMDTMDRIGVRSWLMHGCLLGWWWNGRIMPWDNDIDLMVDERGMSELGNWWNMSVHHFSAQDLGVQDALEADTVVLDTRAEDERLGKRTMHQEVLDTGKKYLLEVNPHYTNTSTEDRENRIDARWIDTATGLFIDITTVHVQPPSSPSTSTSSSHTTLYTKDHHTYLTPQIFPLRTSVFENITVHIPFAYESLLLDEYGPKAITSRVYRKFRFDEERREWLRVDEFGEEVAEEDEEVVMERLRAARERMDYLERVGERQRLGLSRFGDAP